MDTKFIMTASGDMMWTVGVALIFIPEKTINYLDMAVSDMSLFLIQILGALYFGFGMLNWMVRKSRIGGIYNRPIAVANFSHFLVGGLALIKGMISNPEVTPVVSVVMWVVVVFYAVFGISFGIILFKHPKTEDKIN
ncbi:hypothetical protein OOZ15_15385 [Galbibacter sp. EGI 63066]|uniref:hypothetical protein n=1 Tax=Galbibacter sp. EGI 63066 TaxID=2993559 RepID=UPI002248B2C8|nr:hypothetical protein [Galbibacter sp. EGI 63066]MCX2681335.1 hypothetical protein [Galbibacter sp. EGI 63066]